MIIITARFRGGPWDGQRMRGGFGREVVVHVTTDLCHAGQSDDAQMEVTTGSYRRTLLDGEVPGQPLPVGRLPLFVWDGPLPVETIERRTGLGRRVIHQRRKGGMRLEDSSAGRRVVDRRSGDANCGD